jgi:hypothetical protein
MIWAALLYGGVRHTHGGVADGHGRAVQVDPIKPMLKPPGTEPLKLECDGLVSSYALNFKLRRYDMVRPEKDVRSSSSVGGGSRKTRVSMVSRGPGGLPSFTFSST